MIPCNTADGINHGPGRLEECLEAVVIRWADGHLSCPLLDTGGSCEECMEVFERRTNERSKDQSDS